MSSTQTSTPPALDGPMPLGQVAERLGARLQGDADQSVTGVATLDGAGPADITFLANPAYRARLPATGAGAVLVGEDDAGRCPCAALVVEDPYRAWARLLNWWYPAPRACPGVHVSAVVEAGAEVDAGAEIGPLCHVASGARISAGAILGAGCVVGPEAVIGSDSRLVARVWVGPGCVIGERVLLHPGVVVGADGFGLAMADGQWQRLPQIGRARIGDDCDIGANTTIDRGAVGDTVLGHDVRVDNQVQIAHNVEIGDHTAIAGCVGIAGSTRIGRYCMIAGAAGIGGHLEICDRVVITAMSAVLDSIHEPGQYGSGIPARPMSAWRRTLVRIKQLDRWMSRGRGDR